MSEKNMIEMVNVNGQSEENGGRWTMEKMRSDPCTITIPPLKTCTTGTRLQSLRISIVEDDPTTRVLGEGTVGDDMSWVVAKSTEAVWTEVQGVTEVVAKRTVVSSTTILGVAWGVLTAVGTLIFRTVDTKVP